MRLTDATSILAGGYFGMQTDTVEQADIGFTHVCWPDLSYYVGTRYLRRYFVGTEERTSNALTVVITYILDPRYTLMLSNQFDYGLGANIATDVTLIRKYHRLNLALTFGVDETTGDARVMVSLWPEGIFELAPDLRRYMGIGASDVYHY
jgi:hypothetical protein